MSDIAAIWRHDKLAVKKTFQLATMNACSFPAAKNDSPGRSSSFLLRVPSMLV